MDDQNVKPSKVLKTDEDAWTRIRSDFAREIELQRIQVWKSAHPIEDGLYPGRGVHIDVENIKRCGGNLYDALILSQFDYWERGLYEPLFAFKDSYGQVWYDVPMRFWTSELCLDKSVIEHCINHLIQTGLLCEQRVGGKHLLRAVHQGIYYKTDDVEMEITDKPLAVE